MCDEDKFFLLFGSIKKKIYKLINSKIKSYNISVPEAIYLMVIKNNPNASFKEITELIDFDKAMTTKVMNSLKNKDLVNNNIKDITLTKKGLNLSKKINESLSELKCEVLNKLNKEQLKKIFEDIKIFDNLLEEIC